MSRQRFAGQKLNPETAFKTAYAQANRAAELLQEMTNKNVGNMQRKETSKVVELLQSAVCAARSLDNWRKDNPLAPHRENE